MASVRQGRLYFYPQLLKPGIRASSFAPSIPIGSAEVQTELQIHCKLISVLFVPSIMAKVTKPVCTSHAHN
jgi:hypothetical protein